MKHISWHVFTALNYQQDCEANGSLSISCFNFQKSNIQMKLFSKNFEFLHEYASKRQKASSLLPNHTHTHTQLCHILSTYAHYWKEVQFHDPPKISTSKSSNGIAVATISLHGKENSKGYIHFWNVWNGNLICGTCKG